MGQSEVVERHQLTFWAPRPLPSLCPLPASEERIIKQFDTQDNLTIRVKKDKLTIKVAPSQTVRRFKGRFHEKNSCSFGFCPNEGGGGPCPNVLSTFHKLYILGQFVDGEGGRDHCPNFLAHWRSKKVVQVVQIRGMGGGVKVIWTKSKRTATFFGRPSLIVI